MFRYSLPFCIAATFLLLAALPIVHASDGNASRGGFDPVIAEMIGQVDESRIYSTIYDLTNFTTRATGTAGNQNAGTYLYNRLTAISGLTVEYVGGTYRNVVATLPGKDPGLDSVYIVGAHYDSASDTPGTAPGATDDAAGCALVLEFARIMSQYEFNSTIKFACWNAEEVGLLGAHNYSAEALAGGMNISLYLNYDSTAYDPTNNFVLDIVYNSASAFVKDMEVANNGLYGIGFSSFDLNVHTCGGDYQAFTSRGYLAISSHTELHGPQYHKTTDTVDKVNTKFVKMNGQLGMSVMAELAGLRKPVDVQVDDLTISTDSPTEGEELTITVDISNPERFPANGLEVEFYADGEKLGSNFTSVPAAGTSATTFHWLPAKGTHNISVILDPLNKFIDRDLTNNTAFIWVEVNDFPTAVLTANKTSLFTHENIMFNGSDSMDDVGGVEEYLFDFGDGNSSGWLTASEAVHQYAQDDAYTVALTVKDVDGLLSDPVEIVIDVLNRAPQGSLSANLTRAKTFVPIQFLSNGTDLDGSVTLITWDFADGTYSSEPEPVHIYSKSGSYEVSLELEDDDKASVSYSLNIVIENRGPTAGINASSLSGNITTKFIFTATANDLDGTIEAYDWDLGDEDTDTGQEIEHTYEQPGNYTVTLTVTDDEGFAVEGKLNITIIDLPPVPVVKDIPSEVNTFEDVYFDAQKSYDLEGPITYQWDFGDGNLSTEASPKHMYPQPGEYTVVLSVTDSIGQEASFTFGTIVVLNRPPLAEFVITGNLTTGDTVVFDATTSSDREGDIVTFSWDFGDGGTATGPVAEHVFENPGNHTITLTITDGHGAEASVEQTIYIEEKEDDTTPGGGGGGGDSGGSIGAASIALLLIAIIVVFVLVIALVVFFVLRQKRSKKPETPPSHEGGAVPQAPIAQPQPAPPVQYPVAQPQPAPPVQYPLAQPQSEPVMPYPEAHAQLPVYGALTEEQLPLDEVIPTEEPIIETPLEEQIEETTEPGSESTYQL